MVLAGRTFTGAGGYGLKVGTMVDLSAGTSGASVALTGTSGVPYKITASAAGYIGVGTQISTPLLDYRKFVSIPSTFRYWGIGTVGVIAPFDDMVINKQTDLQIHSDDLIPANIVLGKSIFGVDGEAVAGSPTGTATAEFVLDGKTFQSAASGSLQTGIMTDLRGGSLSGFLNDASTGGSINVFGALDGGAYCDETTVFSIEEANLIAANIKDGVPMFGLTGTGKMYRTLSQIGSVTVNPGTPLVIPITNFSDVVAVAFHDTASPYSIRGAILQIGNGSMVNVSLSISVAVDLGTHSVTFTNMTGSAISGSWTIKGTSN
jgi:hypothetical protein